MKQFKQLGFALLLGGMLLAIQMFLGWRVVSVAAGFSTIWFAISMILLSRPPGIPEFTSDRPGSDEQYVVRRDLVPTLPLLTRLELSLGVACGTCLLIWVTLGMLAR